MKVLVDMNLAPRWVAFLRESGLSAEHWSSLGRADAPDTEIMAFARAQGYVVLTHDLDFSAILAATGGDAPSVVQIRAADIRPEDIGQSVVAALMRAAPELERGALVTVAPNRARMRLLPLAEPD